MPHVLKVVHKPSEKASLRAVFGIYIPLMLVELFTELTTITCICHAAIKKKYAFLSLSDRQISENIEIFQFAPLQPGKV
jgi:hypothetical protein